MPEPKTFLSIDQNSHSLWDTLPKLQVLARHGIRGTHLLEDVDTAFTRRGASLGDARLELARERMYRDGSLDWGAALFYSDFLGRTPLNVRDIEDYTGMSIKSLAKKTSREVEKLFDHYGESDNWQLIGSSYAGDKNHHRTVGDLRRGEIEPFLRQLLQHARQDLLHAFPDADAQKRIENWFDTEQNRLDDLLRDFNNSTLPRLYHGWLSSYLNDGAVALDYTSKYLSLAKAREQPESPLINTILKHYAKFADCYNQAVAETATGIAPLDVGRGELPFFAVWSDDQSMVRAPMFVQDGQLSAGDNAWDLTPAGELPFEALQRDGVTAVVGKALVLVLQVRLPPYSIPLVLPYQGSLYMPAAHRLGELLLERDLIPQAPVPVYRVRFRLLEQMREADVIMRPPPYLRGYLGSDELNAGDFAEQLPECVTRARETLANLKDDDSRQSESARLTPNLTAKIQELETRQRELARDPKTRSQASAVWQDIKQLRTKQLVQLMDAIVDALHVANIEYWDSRGALLPWSIALGGQAFYENLLESAEIYAE